MRKSPKRLNINQYIGLTRENQEIINFKEYNVKGRHVYLVKCNYCNYEYCSTIGNFKDARKSGKCCKKCSNIQNKTYKSLTMSEAQVGIIFSNYKASAKIKKRNFSLSRDEFKELIFSKCHYCGANPNSFRIDRTKLVRVSDSAFLSNGIDRKDNNIGYTIKNSLTCCEDCNRAKRCLSYDQFLQLIKNICINMKLL